MKWILVTGGAKGIGEEICYQLAKAGHSLIIHYRNSEAAALQVIQKCRKLGVDAEALQGDFSSEGTTQAFMHHYQSHFAKTKGIVHNVGEYLIAPLLKTSLETWKALFQTNLFAPFMLTQSLLSSLTEAKGSVIHLGETGVAKGGPKKGAPAYFITKEALWQLTRSFALELAPYSVTVNMVSPGILDNSIDQTKHFLPMKRKGHLSEVAAVVAFLMDSKNHYITGQNIEVAGGFGL